MIALRRLLLVAATTAAAGCATVPPAAENTTRLWRLDCGRFDIADLEGRGPLLMPVSCYLMQDGDDYIMFDAGLPAALAREPERQESQTLTVDRTLAEQFADIGVDPASVGKLVVSHYHGDHHGQAGLFPNATLYIGEGDHEAYRQNSDLGEIAPWMAGSRPLVTVARDTPLTPDGAVTILSAPGHTPGHLAMLVRIGERRFILTGDLVHQRDQLAEARPSGNHVDKERGKREIERIKAIAQREGATIVVGHDLRDIDLLPAFPEAVTD